MSVILQTDIPYDARQPGLPGVRPLDMADWLIRDDAFAEQMALRARLLSERRDEVLAVTDAGQAAAEELLDVVLEWLAGRGQGYLVGAEEVTRPDGVRVTIRRDDPLGTLGHLVQEDLCLLQSDGAQHVLSAAVVCFPASWRLAEKIGRPLIDIHGPVPDYDASLARRVQRLFDGVRPDRPMWRFNALNYADPSLFQPDRRGDEYARSGQGDGYFRSERQCILRLPKTRACVFSIHTFVMERAQVAE